MESRLNPAKIAPAAYRAMAALEVYVKHSSNLEKPLL